MTEAYKPSSIVTSTWAQYREIFSGQLAKLIARQVQATYPRAWQRGRVRVVYLPVASYVVDVAAAAMDLPYRVTGPTEAVAQARAWRPTLARAWKLRYAAGSAYLHLATRHGQRDIDLLYGDSLAIVPDPDSPMRWDLIRSVEIPTTDGAAIRYDRQDDGSYVLVRIGRDGYREPIASMPTLPIVPMYRGAPDRIQPLPDQTLLDLQITTALQLSDIEFRRVYRTTQMWRRSEMSESYRTRGSDIEASPDAVIEIGPQDAVGLVESTLQPRADLEYVELYLRLAAKMMRLPPEIFVSAARSETGAARAWDYRPLLELQEADRQTADEWLGSFAEVAWPGAGVTIRTVPPKQPLPADLLQYAQGVREMMRLGLTSPTREVAIREGIGYGEAERIVRLNISQSRLAGVQGEEDE